MSDQPEPRTVESGPVVLTPASGVTTTQESNEVPAPVSDSPLSSEQETPSPSTTTSTDEGDFVSLEELQAMSEEDLRQFISDNQLTPPVEASGKQDLLDWLLSEFGVNA